MDSLLTNKVITTIFEKINFQILLLIKKIYTMKKMNNIIIFDNFKKKLWKLELHNKKYITFLFAYISLNFITQN